ncbi:hypothetical protein GO608_005760 [Aromatoleum buckelii]|nr:hypothetical protein [Aromatoleum buckelii]
MVFPLSFAALPVRAIITATGAQANLPAIEHRKTAGFGDRRREGILARFMRLRTALSAASGRLRTMRPHPWL